MEHAYDRSAWHLANLYLGSLGAALLGADALHLAGLSESTQCYVSPTYFSEDDPFADFIVHEAAHTFHNCKRRTVGLRETRSKEWLLEIEYRQRETFAYSCEAYARVLERAEGPQSAEPRPPITGTPAVSRTSVSIRLRWPASWPKPHAQGTGGR